MDAGVGAALNKAAAQTKAPTEQFPPNPGKVIIPTEVVQNSFKRVFMEDFIVLAMFFVLVAIFVLSFVDPSDIDKESGRRLRDTKAAPSAGLSGGAKARTGMSSACDVSPAA